jgi:WD40 repeat protein/serine/threonine protein kinase
MTSKPLGNSDEEFASLLAEYDELLARGGDVGQRNSAFPDDVQPEVRSRLHDAAKCVELLEKLRQLESVERPSNESASRPNSDGEPRRLGRFEVYHEVGRGSYGIVFLAVDPLLGRKVALKVPRPETVLSPDLNERFVREAKAVAGLDHPGIVPVLEAAEIGPISYIAAAYCEGPSLTEWLLQQTAPVPIRLAAGIVLHLADSVEHAHRRGILHRDIKPSNILLDDTTPLQGSQVELPFTPKLTDFGLAKVLELQGDQTRSGMILGTPQYMAPEQADGRSEDVGLHTDVYALGCVLYELLTGRSPFAARSTLETLQKVLVDDPVPPSRIRREIPKDFEAICLKCLQKTPERRYPDATSLSADLERFLDGRPTVARPVSTLASGLRWIGRHPAIAGLVLVTCVGLISFLVGTAWHVRSLSQALAFADEMRAEAEHQGDLARIREREIGERLYAADMKLAQDAWNNGNVGQVLELLNQQLPSSPERDLRSFDWHHLWRLSHSEMQTLHAHDGDVYDSQFSPNGGLLATAGKDATAALWNVSDGQLVARLMGHTGEVNAVRFTPDGRLLATCSDDKTVRVWDVSTGQEKAVLRGHEHFVYCLAISSDGKLLASGSRDATVKLWDVETMRCVRTLTGHNGTIGSLAFSTDGTTLASADTAVRLWDTTTWQQTGSLPDHAGTIVAIAVSRDGHLIATTDDERSVKLWDSESGLRVATLEGHREVIQRMAFAPNGKYLVSASKDQTARIWDLERRGLLRVLRGHTDRVWTVSISPDSSTIASADADGNLKLWTHPPQSSAVVTQEHSAPVVAAALSGRGDVFATSAETDPGQVTLWNLSQAGFDGGEPITAAEAVRSLKFLPATETLVGGGKYGNVQTLSPVEADWPKYRSGTTLATSISPDGRLLAAGGDHQRVVLWRTDRRELVAELAGHTNGVIGLSFSPDGRLLASSSHDQTIRIWGVDDHRLLHVLRGHQAGVESVAYSPDGDLLASGSGDHTLKLWNTRTGQNTATLQNNCGPIHSVAFSPDGRTLAAACEDGSVNLWNVNTRQRTLELKEHDGQVRFVEFTSDGAILVSAGQTRAGGSRWVAWLAGRAAGDGPIP